jgi:hypothetical protein
MADTTEVDVAETVRQAHALNQRNWEFDVSSLPEFAGKDIATQRREALVEALDKMDASRRARDLATAAERQKAEAAQQLSQIAARRAEVEAELAALDAQAKAIAPVPAAASTKTKTKE